MSPYDKYLMGSHDHIPQFAVMDELGLAEKERKLVLMYALLNKISWICENGIQFNQNTKPIVDKEVLNKLAFELINL